MYTYIHIRKVYPVKTRQLSTVYDISIRQLSAAYLQYIQSIRVGWLHRHGGRGSLCVYIYIEREKEIDIDRVFIVREREI